VFLDNDINPSLDEPGDDHAHQVGGNKGCAADNQQAPVAYNQEFDAGVIAENGRTSRAQRGVSVFLKILEITPSVDIYIYPVNIISLIR